MMCSRWRAVSALDVTISPQFGGAGESSDGPLNLAGIAHVDRADLHADGRRHGLDDGELADSGAQGGIPKHRRSRHVRRDLLEQLKPFPGQAVFELDEAGGVAARPRHALDVVAADRVGDIHEHDRHRAGCLQQRPQGGGAGDQNGVRRERGQVRRMFAHHGGLALAPEIIDPQIAAVDPPELLHRLQKRRRPVLRVRIAGVDAGDHGDAPYALLRARSERPRNG